MPSISKGPKKTFNITFRVPANKCEEVESTLKEHEAFMLKTHSLTQGKLHLEHYYVSKAQELVNPTDPTQGVTGNFIYSLNEVYIAPDGCEEHMKVGAESGMLSDLMSTITAYENMMVLMGTVIFSM